MSKFGNDKLQDTKTLKVTKNYSLITCLPTIYRTL